MACGSILAWEYRTEWFVCNAFGKTEIGEGGIVFGCELVGMIL
jgi:hypothetical protein